MPTCRIVGTLPTNGLPRMKRLLQALLILIVVAVAAYLLLIDGLVKNLVETEGSKALQARLDVASAEFNLFPTVLALRGVTATDPKAPQRNLFTADKIVLRLELGAALQSQLIAKHAVLHGLRFNQPRAEGDTAAAPASADTAAQESQRQQLRAELGKIQQNVTAIRDRWRQRLQELPDDATLAGYRARGATAELNAAQQQLRGLQAEFDRDRAQLQQQLTSARSLPHLEQGRATVAPSQLTQALVGARFAPLLHQLMGRLNTKPADVGAGQWPVLARKTEVDGQFDAGGTALRFTGTIDNATPQPGHWRQPITFSFANAAGQAGTFSASGALDYNNGPNHRARLAFEALPVQGLAFGDDTLDVTLASALASGQGELSQHSGQIELALDSRFEQAHFNVVASDDPTAQAAAQVLSNTDRFDLQLHVEGLVQQPQIALTSSLDQPLAAAISRALQEPGAAEALRGRLERELGPEFADLQRLTAEFNALQEQLRRKLAALGPAASW